MSKQSPHRRSPRGPVRVVDRLAEARTLPVALPPRRWPSATGWPTPAPEPGRIVGDRFLLRREIGEGACGTVYEAEDLDRNERVAVKVASGVFAASAEGMARFRREAIAASSIGHEGIVEVIDSGRDPDGLQYIAMEFLEGIDLARIIELDGPLELDRALEIAAAVADALAAAHAAGVVHRDLKPANIYLQTREDGTEVVKIIDFGVSKMRAPGPEALELTSPGSILGSPCYMAPEQARGEAIIDGRADIYALGIILYEMLTRRPPFDGDSPMAVIEQHITREPAPPSQQADDRSVPRAVDALVARALAKDPNDRPQTMDELRDELVYQLDNARQCAVRRALGTVVSFAAAFAAAIAIQRPI